MRSARYVQNNKLPTKGLRRACSNPRELAASRGETALFSGSKASVPCILVTASKWCERGLEGGGRWAPALALARPLGDRDGPLAAPWRRPFRPGPWLPASLAPAPRTGPHCVQVANAFSPTFLQGLQSGWDSGGGREKGALCPLHLSPPLPARVCSSSGSGVMLQTVVGHRQPNTGVLLLTQLLFKQ